MCCWLSMVTMARTTISREQEHRRVLGDDRLDSSSNSGLQPLDELIAAIAVTPEVWRSNKASGPLSFRGGRHGSIDHRATSPLGPPCATYEDVNATDLTGKGAGMRRPCWSAILAHHHVFFITNRHQSHATRQRIHEVAPQ